MTTNFGCCERGAMASQPSVHNEERNLLRLRAWEQRNQETSHTKDLNPVNVPLFGEPYKINKGDELSNRIQRMLGSYEDVNNPCAMELLPIPTYVTFSQPDQGEPDKSTKLPFHNQVNYMSTQSQKGPPTNSYSSQPVRTSAASSSPTQHGHVSTLKSCLNHSLASQQKKNEAISHLSECVSLPREMSPLSPDAKPLAFLHSSEHDNADTDTTDMFNRNQLQGSTDDPSASASTTDVSTLNVKQSPKDASLPQAPKTNALASQTFPLLLSSKQPSVVMTQKPTAYVRPMDGQDQVVIESPELKPSPEPYVPLPEVINKSIPDKTKILPQFLETKTNEAQAVEDILREMIHSWPPLLTAIHTPSTDESSKSLSSAKEAENVSSCPGQKSCENSSTDPSQLNQQKSSSPLLAAAHFSGVESTSSSDTESSSRSELDSENPTEEPPQPCMSSSVKTEPDAPAVSRCDWQLGNWMRSNQQNSSESQGSVLVSVSPTHKQPLPSQSFKHSGVDVVDPTTESKPSSHQKECSGNPQQGSKSPQDNCCQHSSQKSPFDSKKLSCSTFSSKPVKATCPDHSEAVVSVKCEDVVATRVKDPCFTDRPKVKTKTTHFKKSKDSSDTKRDIKRTSKHVSLDKRKAESELEPEVTLVLYGHCPSCGVRYPNPCACPAQSPAQPDQLSPAPPIRIGCSKPKAETKCQKAIKITHKHLEKTGHADKASRDRPTTSLLVKINLRLLSRVPGKNQEMPNKAKRSKLAIEQDRKGSGASTKHKRTKTCTKNIHQNAEVDKKSPPRKRRKLENMNTSSTHASIKLESSNNPAEHRGRKKAKKNLVLVQQPLMPKDTAKDSKLDKCNSGERQSSKDAAKSKDSRKHKSSVKHPDHSNNAKKPPKVSLTIPSASQLSREALTNRPLLRFEDRQYPVKYYIKEAKRLKHRADAESDKLSKAFTYLDAAMYFVESGIAMEKDPQISGSSYTMFSETVELLKFVLKLKTLVDPSTPSSEKDFLALCLKCQSLLQMTMFRHKHKTALKYSKTLTDHFNNSAQATHDPSVLTSKVTDTTSPVPSMPSPVNTSTSSGLGFNLSVGAGSGSAVDPAGSIVAVPRVIEQVVLTYVNITSLFLSAHDMWEQAEELAHNGSGMLTELDTVMGPLSLTSSMSSMVCYTRQGVHWLRLDSQKVK